MIEYKEFQLPEEVVTKMQTLTEAYQADPENAEMPTFGNAGMFEWMTEMSAKGWSPIWTTFNFPFIVLEREAVDEGGPERTL